MKNEINIYKGLVRFEATLTAIENGMMFFDNNSVVDCLTINRNRKLKEHLRAPGSINEPRIGARFPLVSNEQGKTYLDLGTCYEKKGDQKSKLFESFTTEIKKSALHCCDPYEEPQSSAPKQWRVLAAVILSFINARAHNWMLYIGYSDNGYRTGLNDEFPDAKAQVEFEVQFKNYVYQVTNSRSFSMSLRFLWEIHDDGLKTLTISAPEWNGDILLLNGNALYVRDGAASIQLKHADMLDYIRTFKSIN